MPVLPQRSKLPHGLPSWVDAHSFFFVTVCTMPKGRDQLCGRGVGERLINSAKFYHDQSTWFVRAFLVMPDHVHAILSLNPAKGMKAIVSDWKRYISRTEKIEWQRDFFDHRLRNEREMTEKIHYVLENPVRAGLVEHSDAWPYRWCPHLDDQGDD
jgi:putative transposase